jgi:hypothetical protein
MQHVIDTLDGWVPSDFSPKAMRWMPPELAAVERAKFDAEALAEAVELGEIVPEPAR